MTKTYFTEDHEWIRVEGGIATIGITDYAQEQLGDIVFVELPEVGKKLARGDTAVVVESVKAASDVSRRSTAKSPRPTRRFLPTPRWSIRRRPATAGYGR